MESLTSWRLSEELMENKENSWPETQIQLNQPYMYSIFVLFQLLHYCLYAIYKNNYINTTRMDQKPVLTQTVSRKSKSKPSKSLEELSPERWTFGEFPVLLLNAQILIPFLFFFKPRNSWLLLRLGQNLLLSTLSSSNLSSRESWFL